MSKFQQVLLSLLFLLGTQDLTRVVHAQEVDRFHRYQDNSGFSCDFPQSWKFDQSTHNDRVFGDATGKYPDATIIIQVIDRSLTKLKTAKEQLEDLANQIKAVPDAAIVAQSTAPFAGQDAPFFIASYTTKDTKSVLRPFKHVQAVATTEKYFLLMSYSAPIAEFDVNLKVFQNCAATMEFKAPQGQVVPPISEAAPPPAVTEGPKPASPSAAEQTKFWYRNTQEGFWVAVPSNWQSKETPGNAFVLEMKDPERLEGIIVWAVKLPRSVKSDLWANSWEEHLSGKVFFMEKRLVTSNLKHPGSGVKNTSVILREYQGQHSGATVRSVAAYVTNGRKAYTPKLPSQPIKRALGWAIFTAYKSFIAQIIKVLKNTPVIKFAAERLVSFRNTGYLHMSNDRH